MEAVRQSQGHMPAKVVEISTTFSICRVCFLWVRDSGFYHTPFQLFFLYNIENRWLLKNYQKMQPCHDSYVATILDMGILEYFK